MAIINISGKSRGKILRVHGATNYLSESQDQLKLQKKRAKAVFYNNLTNQVRSPINPKNNMKIAKRLNSGDHTIALSSIIKVIEAYQITIQGQHDKAIVNRSIEKNLLNNLNKLRIHHDVVKNIVKHERVKIVIPKKTAAKSTKSSTDVSNANKKKRGLSNREESRIADGYRVLHNYLTINPYRLISKKMYAFWQQQVSPKHRLNSLQRLYQLKAKQPDQAYKALIKQHHLIFMRNELKYLEALWGEG